MNVPEESKKTTNSTMLEADKEGIRNYARALSDEEKVIILQEIEPRFIFSELMERFKGMEQIIDGMQNLLRK